MTEIILNENVYNNIKIIIKYQNSLLLKRISEDYNWNFEELKKTYLKNKIKKEKIIDNQMVEKEKDYKKCGKIKIKVKKKRTQECYKFTFNNKIYYINPKNNNAYDKDGVFLGVKEEDIINFDMEETE